MKKFANSPELKEKYLESFQKRVWFSWGNIIADLSTSFIHFHKFLGKMEKDEVTDNEIVKEHIQQDEGLTSTLSFCLYL